MTRPALALALLAAAVAGGLCGYWLGASPGRLPMRDHARAAAAEATQPAAASGRADPSATATAMLSGQGHRDTDLESLRKRAQEDPAYLRELLRRFAAEQQADTRGALLAVLSGVPHAEVLRTGKALAGSADPRLRKAGLELLTAFPLSEPEVRQLLTGQLGSETDPAMLKQLLGMLTPSTMPTEDAAPVVERLSALSQHPDPGVRSQSVLQLAQWDRGGDSEAMLHRAILDAAPEVRRAAMAGMVSAHVRSDRLKDALLEIASNPQSSAADRGAAVFALQEFPLSRAEYGLYQQAAATSAEHDPH